MVLTHRLFFINLMSSVFIKNSEILAQIFPSIYIALQLILIINCFLTQFETDSVNECVFFIKIISFDRFALFLECFFDLNS